MPRKISPLVDSEIKNAKPSNKAYTMTDGNGLFLFIDSNGSKLWRFVYYRPLTKKRAKMSLGKYPIVTLSDARKLRDYYRKLLSQQIDPQEYIQNQKLIELQDKQNTLFYIAEQWKVKKSHEVKAKTIEKNWRRLELYLFPTLGNKAIKDITPLMVTNTMNPVFKKGIIDTGLRVIRMLNEIMVFAVNKGLIEFNKCTNVADSFIKVKSNHNPTIRPEELPEFFVALNDSNADLMVKLLIKFLLLTMTRPNESTNAKWSEFDFKKCQWHIPAERMKMNEPFIIPLSSQAIKILEKLKPITGRSQYVFQSKIYPSKPMNSQTANATIKRIGYKGKLTSHGLRSIASTYLSEKFIDINIEVLEACLSHKGKNQVRNAYNRSTYLEQRKPLMDEWGNFIEDCFKKAI